MVRFSPCTLMLAVLLVGLCATGGADATDAPVPAPPPRYQLRLAAFLPFCYNMKVCGWPRGESLKIAVEMAKDALNAAHFLGPDVELHIEYADSACDSDKAPLEFARLVLDKRTPHIFGILGPACSGPARTLAPFADMARMPLISGSASQPFLSNRQLYPNFWRTVTAISTWRPIFTLVASWKWKTLGVTWGAASNFQEIWDDTKNVCRELGLSMQVPFGALHFGEEATTEESLAHVIDIETAIHAARQLKRKRVRSVVAIQYEPEARLLLCAQRLLGVRDTIWITYGWLATSWYHAQVDFGTFGTLTGLAKGSCTPEEMALQVGRPIMLNHMDWHHRPQERLLDCGMDITAGRFRADYEARALAAGQLVSTEAGTFADAVCMFARGLRELIRQDNCSAACLSDVTPALFERFQDILARTNFSGPGGDHEYKLAAADRTQNKAGDRLGPMIVQQLVDGSVEDKKAVLYPYGPDDISDVGGGFDFVGDDGRFHASPPIDLFPACDDGMQYDFEVRQCLPCPSKMAYSILTESCECDFGNFRKGNSCSPCLAGEQIDVMGSDVCKKCKLGEWSPVGSRVCLDCPSGAIPFESKAGCELCRLGLRADRGDSRCSPSARYIGLMALEVMLLFAGVHAFIFHLRRAVKITDVSQLGEQLVVTTCSKHGVVVRLRCLKTLARMRGGPTARFVGTESRAISESTRYRLLVLDAHRVEVQTLDGHSITIPGDSSRGYFKLCFPWDIICGGSGVPPVVSLVVSLIVGFLFAVLSLYVDNESTENKPAGPEVAAGTVLITILAAVSYARVIRHREYWSLSPMEQRHEDFMQKLVFTNPKPIPCERGAGRAVLVKTLVNLLNHYRDFIRERNAYYLDPNIIRPLTKAKQLSFAEIAGPVRLDFFVSHFWGFAFSRFVSAIQSHAEGQAQRMGQDWKNFAYWICFLSNNQYCIEAELGHGDWRQSSFYRGLQSETCRGTCMVLDAEALPLTRSWCLFEVLTTYNLLHDDSKSATFGGLQFCTAAGVLGDPSSHCFDVAVALAHRLTNLDVASASASNHGDQEMIKNLVITQCGSLEDMNDFIRGNMISTLQKVQTTFTDDLKHVMTTLGRRSVVKAVTRTGTGHSDRTSTTSAPDDSSPRTEEPEYVISVDP